MDSSLTTSFYNELAAVPSLHVGFAFAVGFAVAASSSNRSLKVAGHLWGPIVALAVVATGNHYVFDIVAGMVAAAIGYGAAVLSPAERRVAARCGSRSAGLDPPLPVRRAGLVPARRRRPVLSRRDLRVFLELAGVDLDLKAVEDAEVRLESRSSSGASSSRSATGGAAGAHG